MGRLIGLQDAEIGYNDIPTEVITAPRNDLARYGRFAVSFLNRAARVINRGTLAIMPGKEISVFEKDRLYTTCLNILI